MSFLSLSWRIYAVICAKYFIICVTNTTKYVPRSAYDDLSQRMAQMVASQSLAPRNFSAQFGTPLTTPKVKTLDLPLPSVAPPDPTSSPVQTYELLPQLNRVNFPSVKMWEDHKYNGHRKGGRRGGKDDPQDKPKGLVLSSYMEDENGEEILKGTRDHVRKTARSLFAQLLQRNEAPITWGAAPLNVQTELVFKLEKEYPFLQLCTNHWKAEKVATNSYSQWYGRVAGHQVTAEAQVAIKVESDVKVININADDSDEDRSSKRPRTVDTNTRASKHPHTEKTKPPLPPRPLPTKAHLQGRKVSRPFYFDYMRL